MAVLPPPRSSFRALLRLRNASDPDGQELRDSWSQTLTELGAPAGQAANRPASSWPSPDPAVGNYDAGEKIQAAVSEVGQRLCALRTQVVVDGVERVDWTIQGNGASLVTVREPTLAEATQAAQDLLLITAPSLPGMRGQRNAVVAYFAHHLALVPSQHAAVLELLDAAVNVALPPVFTIKNTALVPRPWALETMLLPERLERAPLWHSSFPSGHAVGAYTTATLLSRMVGANQVLSDTSSALARIVARNRERGWVHTRLDSDAGQAIGVALGNWLYEAATSQAATYPLWASMQEYARQSLPPSWP
ncbi:MAG: hypothetical protein WAQ05_15450 [Rubrivivax sp.]